MKEKQLRSRGFLPLSSCVQLAGRFFPLLLQQMKTFRSILIQNLMNSLLFQLWFAFVNGFSGQILFERWCIGLYNVVSILHLHPDSTQSWHSVTFLYCLCLGSVSKPIICIHSRQHKCIFRAFVAATHPAEAPVLHTWFQSEQIIPE